MTDLAQLKQAFQDADQEYQFAMVAGDPIRLTKALAEHRRTFDAYDRALKKKFKKTFVSTVGKKTDD